MNFETYTMYRNQAINAGWIPTHVDSLTPAEVKKLVSTEWEGVALLALLNKSSFSTVKKFAVANYGLNPAIASNMSKENIIDFIVTESIYKQEGIAPPRLSEGPFYPGTAATAQLNSNPSLYATYVSPAAQLYPTLYAPVGV